MKWALKFLPKRRLTKSNTKTLATSGQEVFNSPIEAGRKPKTNPEKGIIYVFQTPDSKNHTLYKIGRTKDLKKRPSSHQSALAGDIKLILVFETDDQITVEKCVKLMLKKYNYRKYKEIYQIDADTISSTIQGCANLAKISIRDVEIPDMTGGAKNYFMLFDFNKINKIKII